MRIDGESNLYLACDFCERQLPLHELTLFATEEHPVPGTSIIFAIDFYICPACIQKHQKKETPHAQKHPRPVRF
jgi:hypothetical protein